MASGQGVVDLVRPDEAGAAEDQDAQLLHGRSVRRGAAAQAGQGCRGRETDEATAGRLHAPSCRGAAPARQSRPRIACGAQAFPQSVALPEGVMTDDASPALPAHIEATVQAIARLRTQHENRATPVERLLERLTAAIGRPAFLMWLVLIVVVWTLGNAWAARVGYPAPDPPPFPWLQGAISFLALSVTVIILTSQRRADQLAGLREQLTLELAILGEQKTAKVIDLLEEHRRDNPLIADRDDPEASDMAKPADPEAVLDAIATSPPEPESSPAS
jgi:uncharacterized membrane protein